MKKYFLVLLLMAMILLLIGGCTEKTGVVIEEPDNQAVYHKISQEDAKKRMDSDQDVLIIDVREKSEYDSGHIIDAVLVPLGSIAQEIGEVAPDKDTVLLVYCRSGSRSKTAANDLVNLGYTEVYDFGGINTWPYDIVK